MKEVKGEKEKHVSAERNQEKSFKLPLHDFLKINLITFSVPLYGCLAVFLLFEYYFIRLFSIPVQIHFLLLPPFFLFLYYLYMVILIETCRIWVNYWNRKSPPKQGVFQRILTDKNSEIGQLLVYYHKRGFIIKYPVWITSKSPFPWLVKRALRRIGHNKIGKNVVYEDCYYGLEFTHIEDDVFIYPTSAISSHEVNSIFGKLTLLEVKLDKKTILYPGIIVGPGAETEANHVIYPNTVLHKNWRGVPNEFYYQGSPGKPFKNLINKAD
ncbi:MAG: hypothetical protein ACTSU4_02160 [Promethearchaeota archaeon]